MADLKQRAKRSRQACQVLQNPTGAYDEIQKLRQQLEQAEARAAELEHSVTELIQHYSETWDLPILERAEAARDGAGYPWLLRKQAEALDEQAEDEKILFGYYTDAARRMRYSSQRLRQQADEAEKAGENHE